MYQLRIYGPPITPDQDYEDVPSAIKGARQKLKARQGLHHGGFAEIRDKWDSRIVWTGFVDKEGKIVEWLR